MTTPAAGNPISLGSDVGVELGKVATAELALGSSEVRALLGTAAGSVAGSPVALGDLRGKSSKTIIKFSAGGVGTLPVADPLIPEIYVSKTGADYHLYIAHYTLPSFDKEIVTSIKLKRPDGTSATIALYPIYGQVGLGDCSVLCSYETELATSYPGSSPTANALLKGFIKHIYDTPEEYEYSIIAKRPTTPAVAALALASAYPTTVNKTATTTGGDVGVDAGAYIGWNVDGVLPPITILNQKLLGYKIYAVDYPPGALAGSYRTLIDIYFEGDFTVPKKLGGMPVRRINILNDTIDLPTVSAALSPGPANSVALETINGKTVTRFTAPTGAARETKGTVTAISTLLGTTAITMYGPYHVKQQAWT